MEKWEKKYTEWVAHPNLSSEEKQHLINYSEEEKKESFYKYLDFGTGGMRGKIGLGTNLINQYTIKRVSKALAIYLKGQGKPKDIKKVVISYDNRHYSREFASWAAQVLAAESIVVYLSDSMRPTPQLSFLVRELGADAGVMITASHNPKEYNGYKIYDHSGGQITLETAEELKALLENIGSELEIETAAFTSCIAQNKIILLSNEADNLYLKKLATTVQDIENTQQHGEQLKVLYTPLHGSGEALIRESFSRFGFKNLTILSEQADGDPNFRTVSSPNPEEKSAFSLALKMAEHQTFDFIFATDPDADRMGIVVFDEKKQPVFLTGNQIGVLILDFLIKSKSQKNEVLSDYFIAKTIVTSDLGEKIAQKNQIDVKNTLTGFKFIGEQIEIAEKNHGLKFLFGYEESFGYLIDSFVRDKDAIQAALVFAECVLEGKKNNQTPLVKLAEIYQEYGYFKERLETVTFEGMEGVSKIAEILDKLRNRPLERCGDLKVRWLEDYLVREKKNQLTGEASIINLPQSNVIKYTFEDDSWICIRPSGTEPKCKIYYSVNGHSEEEAEWKITKLVKSFNKLIL